MDFITSRLSQSSQELQNAQITDVPLAMIHLLLLVIPVMSSISASMVSQWLSHPNCCPSHAWDTGIFGEADSFWVRGTVITVILRYWHGEGNGTPLQYSCLENPMEGGAWWAVVHGVAKSRHDWATSLSLFTFLHWRRKWQPTPVFLPGESQRQRSLVGCRLWGRTESDATKRLSSSKILTTSCHYLSLSPCLPKHAPLMLLFLELYFFNAFMVLPNATSTINFWLFFFPGKKQSRQGARSRLLAWCAEKG